MPEIAEDPVKHIGSRESTKVFSQFDQNYLLTSFRTSCANSTALFEANSWKLQINGNIRNNKEQSVNTNLV